MEEIVDNTVEPTRKFARMEVNDRTTSTTRFNETKDDLTTEANRLAQAEVEADFIEVNRRLVIAEANLNEAKSLMNEAKAKLDLAESEGNTEDITYYRSLLISANNSYSRALESFTAAQNTYSELQKEKNLLLGILSERNDVLTPLLNEMRDGQRSLIDYNRSLNKKFDKVFGKNLEPINASKVTVSEFDKFNFVQFAAKDFDKETLDEVIENYLTEYTRKVISLYLNESIILSELDHIHPESEDLLTKLHSHIQTNLIAKKEDLTVVKEFEFSVDTDSSSYKGYMDRGILDIQRNIIIFTWEDKNPKEMVPKSNPSQQQAKRLYSNYRITTNGKTGLAQAALQISSQVKNLDVRLGNKPFYGILTNGMEWFVVEYCKGKWRHSQVMSPVNENHGTLLVNEEVIQRISKALLKVMTASYQIYDGLEKLINVIDKSGEDRKENEENSSENDDHDVNDDKFYKSVGITKEYSLAINLSSGEGSSSTFGQQNASKNLSTRELNAKTSNLTTKNVEQFKRRTQIESIKRNFQLLI